MDDLAKKQFEEDKMVNDAFQHLIDTYLASRHRKRWKSLPRLLILPNKPIKECAAFPANLTSCIRWP